MKLTQLTEKTWLVKDGINDSGILFENEDHYNFLTTSKNIKYTNEKDIKNKFGKLPRKIKDESEPINDINGYPVKHDNITILENQQLPLYTRGTKVIFAAGYWCVRFDQSWSTIFCPKQKTLEVYDNFGPYKNKFEMNAQLNKLKNEESLKNE